MIRGLYITLAALITLSACQKSDVNNADKNPVVPEGKMSVTLSLDSNTPLSTKSEADKSQTKAVVTPSQTDDYYVGDLVVLQYDMQNSEGQLIDKQYIYSLTQQGTAVSVNVNLKPMRKTRIIVLANTASLINDEQLPLGSSIQTLENITFDINATAGAGIPEDYSTALPMKSQSGDITLKEGQVETLKMTLYRLVAKVNFKLVNGCMEGEKRFEPTKVTLRNVPTIGTLQQVVSTNFADKRFPERDAQLFRDYDPINADMLQENMTDFVWYMAPNNGGTGTGQSAADKMNPTFTPTNFCSFVEVSGNIYIADVPYAATYRLYLGKNNFNDYNVWANEAYNIYLYIQSLPDDPEEIPDYSAEGLRIEMKATQMHNMTVDGWVLGIQKATVDPDPSVIMPEGGAYTVTLESDTPWEQPLSVRVWDGENTLAQGPISYNDMELGGSIKLQVPENRTGALRPVTFQFQWEGEWMTIQSGTQLTSALQAASVAPDPTTIPYAGQNYTVTLSGVWSGDVPVRVWDITNMSEVVKGNVTYDEGQGGGQTELAVPQNPSAQNSRILEFQYWWDEIWVPVRRGTQQAAWAITGAAVSPDPSGGFSSAATAFTVTLTGTWSGSVPVRAIVDGQDQALVSGSVTTSGTGVQLTVPANSSTTSARTVLFQYQWDNSWVEIDRGTQAAGENIDQGGGIEISPDPGSKMTWADAINYCKNKGDGWRLPTQNELMYLWCLTPSFTGEAVFAAGIYWAATQYGSSAFARYVNFSHGGTSTCPKTYSSYVRCVKGKGTIGQTYPYITTASDGGVVIVLRDENGGVDEANLFPYRLTASSAGDEQNTYYNRMSRKIRVQKAQGQSSKVTWDNAKSYCEGLTDEGYSDWRLPTQRELMLIWNLGGSSNVTAGDKNDTGVGSGSVPLYTPYLYQQSGFTALAADGYWTATRYSSNYTFAWYVHFNLGNTDSNDKTYSYYVRCVRDEW